MENLMGRYRNVTILAAAIFLQVVGLAVQVKRRTENDSTRLIRVWAVGLVTPLERGVVRVQNSARDIWSDYFYLRGVRQQNRELQDQLQKLQLEQVRLRQDAEQAHRLQALLAFKEQFIDKTVAAQVIATSGSEQSRTVYLDKGSDNGIAQDMAVIAAAGIVGKVTQVFRHTSQVLLINDQTSGVGTILEQSRLQGVLKGRPNGEVMLDKIMSDEEVKPGDHVLTSGGDQIFPKGLPVGTVEKVTHGPEFLQVTVKPAASLNHLEEVLIITKKIEREPALSTAGTPLRAADILAQRLPTVPDAPPSPTGAAGGTTKLGTNGTAVPVKPVANTSAGTGAQAGTGAGRLLSNPAPTTPQTGGLPKAVVEGAQRTQANPGATQSSGTATRSTSPNPSGSTIPPPGGTDTNSTAPAKTQGLAPSARKPGEVLGAPAKPQSTTPTTIQGNAPMAPKSPAAVVGKTAKPATAPSSRPVVNKPAQTTNSGEAPQ